MFVCNNNFYYDVIIFADVGIFVDDVIENPTFTKKTITREPLIVEKWLTPQIKGLI